MEHDQSLLSATAHSGSSDAARMANEKIEKIRGTMAENAAREWEAAARLAVDDTLRRMGFPAAMRERLLSDEVPEAKVETLQLVRIPGLEGGGVSAPTLFSLQRDVVEGLDVVCEIRITGGDLRMALHGLRAALRGVVL